MQAWVCFQCPAHSRKKGEFLAHKRKHPSHVAEIVTPSHSHRWATLHGAHPNIKGHCDSPKHKEE